MSEQENSEVPRTEETKHTVSFISSESALSSALPQSDGFPDRSAASSHTCALTRGWDINHRVSHQARCTCRLTGFQNGYARLFWHQSDITVSFEVSAGFVNKCCRGPRNSP